MNATAPNDVAAIARIVLTEDVTAPRVRRPRDLLEERLDTIGWQPRERSHAFEEFEFRIAPDSRRQFIGERRADQALKRCERFRAERRNGQRRLGAKREGPDERLQEAGVAEGLSCRDKSRKGPGLRR